MTVWPTTRLHEIAKIRAGGSLQLTGKHFVAAGVPAYGAGGLNGYVTTSEYEGSAVILSSIGARCGKCFYVNGEWTSLANTQVIFPDPARVDAKFLWYQLNDERRWHRSGTAQPFIKPADVKNSSVFLPSLAKQKRIADVLDRADALRANRREALALLEELTQSIFLDMFGRHSSRTSWPLDELQSVVRKGTLVSYGIVQAGDEVEGGVPYIRTGDLVDGEIRLDGLRHTAPEIASKFQRSNVVAGDLVISIRATVGTTAMVPAVLTGANLTQGTARIAPGDRVSPRYLLEYLRSADVQSWIKQQIKGATFLEITLGRLRELQVLLPPMELQEAFDERMRERDRLRAAGRKDLCRLDDLFASLQQRAFAGEL